MSDSQEHSVVPEKHTGVNLSQLYSSIKTGMEYPFGTEGTRLLELSAKSVGAEPERLKELCQLELLPHQASLVWAIEAYDKTALSQGGLSFGTKQALEKLGMSRVEVRLVDLKSQREQLKLTTDSEETGQELLTRDW